MTKSRLDLKAADLKVYGDPNAVDSFAACLVAVLDHFDQPACYPFVEALTGACFSPCYNKGEDCTGWMVDGGSAARAPWMAGALGLELEILRVDPAAPTGSEWLETYREKGELPPERSAFWEQVHSAWRCGSAILLGTWPAWSILTGWDDDVKRLTFSTTPGFEDIVSGAFPPAQARIALAFTPAPKTLSHADAMREGLRYGARIAAGEISPRLEGYDGEIEVGSAVYGRLAALALEPDLCPGCQESGCFQRAVKRIHDGQEAAVDFFKEARQWVPDAVHELSLENLIEQYDHMAHLTRKYIDLPDFQTLTASPEFRDTLHRDFARLQTMQVQAAEHFRALVEDL